MKPRIFLDRSIVPLANTSPILNIHLVKNWTGIIILQCFHFCVFVGIGSKRYPMWHQHPSEISRAKFEQSISLGKETYTTFKIWSRGGYQRVHPYMFDNVSIFSFGIYSLSRWTILTVLIIKNYLFLLHCNYYNIQHLLK